MTVLLSRRGVLRCLTGLIAAPAIVRYSSLMPIPRVSTHDLWPGSANVFGIDYAGGPDGSLWMVKWGSGSLWEVFPCEHEMRDDEFRASVLEYNRKCEEAILYGVPGSPLRGLSEFVDG